MPRAMPRRGGGRALAHQLSRKARRLLWGIGERRPVLKRSLLQVALLRPFTRRPLRPQPSTPGPPPWALRALPPLSSLATAAPCRARTLRRPGRRCAVEPPCLLRGASEAETLRRTRALTPSAGSAVCLRRPWCLMPRAGLRAAAAVASRAFPSWQCSRCVSLSLKHRRYPWQRLARISALPLLLLQWLRAARAAARTAASPTRSALLLLCVERCGSATAMRTRLCLARGEFAASLLMPRVSTRRGGWAGTRPGTPCGCARGVLLRRLASPSVP